MSRFKNGDLVVTPSGRIAKVNRYWEESRRDDCARVDLTYADNGEPVRLAPSLLKLYEGGEPQPQPSKDERKSRSDFWEPKRNHLALADCPPPILDPIEQLLLMDGCMQIQIQGQAGGLASSRKRRVLN